MDIKKIAILIVTMALLTSCNINNSTNPTYEEFNQLKTYTYINKNSINEIKDSVTRFIQILYNPSSQKDLDSSYKIIESFSEKEFIDDLKINVNSYKEGKSQQVVINSIEYGNRDNQFDNMDKLLADVSISSEDYEPTRVLIEFSFNSNGNIFKYDIWQYINEGD